MRVLVCPDKFAGTLPAIEVAAALAAGWAEAAPDDTVVGRPLSDGGPGFLDVIEAGTTGGRRVSVPTWDPLGRRVEGSVLVVGSSAYVESAHACGLHLLAPEERDPKVTTSYGLGALLAAAVESGAREVVVGLGGSATNDAGAGMLAALGAAPLDEGGYALPYGGAALAGCGGLGGLPRLRQVALVAATDVAAPLVGPSGASAVFGPQKGASRADVAWLDAALARFATVLERDLPGCPPGLADRPGGGAAGGIGAALLACGARREPGFDLVARRTGLDRELDQADLIITGEGRVDAQSLLGKVVAGVAAAASKRGVPCVVVAGQVEMDRREARTLGVAEIYSLAGELGSVEEAMARTADGLRTIATRLARRWR